MDPNTGKKIIINVQTILLVGSIKLLFNTSINAQIQSNAGNRKRIKRIKRCEELNRAKCIFNSLKLFC